MTRKRVARWAAGIAAVLGALVPAAAGIAPAIATAAVPTVNVTATSTVNTPGSQWLASCLNSGRTLSVLFVLDVSGSLTSTDPSGFRYEGLKTALTTLATAKPADGSDVTIEAAVAGFGNQWHSTGDVVPWQKINIDSPDNLIDAMVSRARDQTAWRQEGTGFQFVIQNATNELTSRGGAESCKAVVWFTDGDPSDPEAVTDMCRVGGAVDQMRNAGIVLIGLRLSVPGQPLTSSAMPIMTLGQSGSETCGTVPIPESAAPGIFLDASDVKRLFASIQSIVEGCTVTDSAHIDPGIRRVRVNIYQGVDSVKFDLPGGISFTAGTSGNSGPFDGIDVTSVREDFYVSMELSLPQGVGAGDWLVSSTLPLTADDVEYCVFSDLHLELDDATMANLEAGVAGALTVHVLGPDGAAADLTDYATAATAASLVGPDGQPRTVEASMSPNGHDIDLLVRTDPADARLDLSVTLTLTTQSGLVLTPLKLETAVITALNEYYPKVTPLDELDLGEALREDETSAELTIVGSDKGPTSVCFDAPVKVSVPPDAANADPVYAVGCIDLAAGETRTLTVGVSTTTAVEGDGAAEIPIQIHAAPDSTGYEGEAVLNLPVKWRFSNPLNVGVLIWALVAVIAAAVLIPLIAILWANWVTARFDVTNLQVARIRLIIDSNGIRRVTPLDGGSDGIVGRSDSTTPRGARKSMILWGRTLVRGFEVEGVAFRARASWNPFKPARFWAEVSEGTLVLSSFGAQTGKLARASVAPFAPAFDVAAVWTVRQALISRAGPVEGMLLVLKTRGGRRDPKVDPDPVVRAVPWSALLASHRPKIDGSGSPGAVAKKPGLPPTPGSANTKRTPPIGR